MLTPSFNAISGDYSIQDILPSGDVVLGEGETTLQILDADGTTNEAYTWYTEEGSFYMVDEPGWYNSDYEKVDKKFNSATAFIVQNDNGEFTVQFAGQVEFETKPVDCVIGYTSIGNCTPVTKDIQQYIPAGDVVVGEGETTLQVLEYDGTTNEAYTWYTEEGSFYMVDEPGWYNSDYEKVTRPFAAGEAFIAQNDNGEYVVTIPGTNDVLDAE